RDRRRSGHYFDSASDGRPFSQGKSVTRASHFYAQEIETLSSSDLRKLQDQRLRSLIAELSSNAFYQTKARSAGLELSRIECAEDLRSLPFTTKQELVDEQI